MPPMKLQRKRSSNGRRRRVAMQEALKWQLAPFWQSDAQRETRGRGAQWWPSSLPKTPPPFQRRRLPQCWRTSPRPRMETLPGGVPAMSTPLRCPLMLSAHAVPCRTPVMTVNGSRTCNSPSTPTLEGRSSAGHNRLLEETRRRTARAPARVLAALPAVEPHRTGKKCRPVGVGMTWRRLITTGAMRQWRPRLEEVNRQVRQFGVAVPGRVVHLGLRARTLHETGKLLVVTDCSNAFNTVKRTAMPAEEANCVQRSRRLWPSATVHRQRTCSFGRTRGKPEESLAPTVSN